MTNINNKLATLIAELDTLESQRRSMLEAYMPIKNRIIELKDEIDELETQVLSEEQKEDDARFDELIESINNDKSRFDGILQKGDVSKSLHQIKMDKIKDLESPQ